MTCTADDNDVGADGDDLPTDMDQYCSCFWQEPVQHIYIHTFVRPYVRITERSIVRRISRVAKSNCWPFHVCLSVLPSAPHGTTSLLLDGFL